MIFSREQLRPLDTRPTVPRTDELYRAAGPQVIQNPEIARKLARALDVKASAAPSLNPVVQPVVLVSDLTDPIISDTDYERDAVGFDNKGPVAARFAEAQILNPVSSAVIILVEEVIVSSDTAQEVQIRAQDTVLIAPQTLNRGFRNRALAGEPAAQQAVGDSAAQSGDVVAGARTLANQSVQIPLGITLPPGTGIKVAAQAVNTSLTVTWFWTEFAEAS